MNVQDQLAATFADAGAKASVHAREIQPDGGEAAELGLDPDRPVAAASVIKIVIAVAFARAVATGQIDPSERLEVPDALRTGGSGTGGFADPALISLRDLALLMMTVSDNAATDLVYARVGQTAISAVLTDLDLKATHLRSDMGSAGKRVAAELGFPDQRDFDARLAAADPAAVKALAWLDPARANATTARDMTKLLAAIWTDRAGPPSACAFVRDAMERRENTQRLASGFAGDVQVAGKTGTLPFVRNEAGVISYPDGRRYAVAVFTRTESAAPRDPVTDAAIGNAARIAVELLQA